MCRCTRRRKKPNVCLFFLFYSRTVTNLRNVISPPIIRFTRVESQKLSAQTCPPLRWTRFFWTFTRSSERTASSWFNTADLGSACTGHLQLRSIHVEYMTVNSLWIYSWYNKRKMFNKSVMIIYIKINKWGRKDFHVSSHYFAKVIVQHVHKGKNIYL